MSPPKPDAPHPAAVGLVWKAVGAILIPVCGAALLLWRSDALQTQEIAGLRADLAAVRADLASHLEIDRRRVETQADRERDAAVAQARIAAAVEAVRGQIDAVLTALSRRRPG